MVVIIYGDKLSPPVRSVILLAETLGIEYEFRLIDLVKYENLKPDFVAKNPMHSVPVLEDEGKLLIDSHAILGYLASQYGKDDRLYPTDPYQRALVDQRLHFDSGILYVRLRDMSMRIYLEDKPVLPDTGVQALYQAFGYLEQFLESQPFLAGEHLTIADISCICSVTSSAMYAQVTPEKYPKTAAWVQRVIDAMPRYDEANGKDNERYLQFLKTILEMKLSQ